MGRPAKTTQPTTQAPATVPHTVSTPLDVFTIIAPAREGDKSYWCKVGAAWKNRDGSINITLHALPVNGKLQIREPQPRQSYGGYSQTQPTNPQDVPNDAHEAEDDLPF